MSPRRYSIPDDDQTPTMFDELSGGMRDSPRTPYVPPVAFGACPGCTSTRVGLVPGIDGRHLMWKLHRKKVGAAYTTCQVSGQRLCDYPSRDIPSLTNVIPHCPHQN